MTTSLTYLRDKFYRFAYRLIGSEQDAEDVAQDVCIKLLRHGERYDNLEAVGMRAVRNAVIDRSRSKHYQSASLARITEPADEATPYRRAEHRDLLLQVERIVARLPEAQRTIFHLRDVEGMTYDEMAAVTGQSMAQVKVNLHRARSTIKTELQRLEHYGL